MVYIIARAGKNVNLTNLRAGIIGLPERISPE
jgi:hypothetical protein